jgi:hypothetical protein
VTKKERAAPREGSPLENFRPEASSSANSNANQAQLIRTIKAHIAAGDKAAEKSEQHYVSAGQHIKTLKANHTGTWAEWMTLLKTEIGISKSRASELMMIADGRKTAESVAADRRKRQRDAKIAKNQNLSVDDGEIGATPYSFSDGKQGRAAIIAPSKRRQASERPTITIPAVSEASAEAMKAKFAALDGAAADPPGHKLTKRQREKQEQWDRWQAQADQVAAILLKRLGRDALMLVRDAAMALDGSTSPLAEAVDRQIGEEGGYCFVEEFLAKYAKAASS